jgi:hypothetical protein
MSSVSRLAIFFASCMTTSLLSATALASLREATSFSSSASDCRKTAPRISSEVQEASSFRSNGYLPTCQQSVTNPLDRLNYDVLEAETPGFFLGLDIGAKPFELLVGCPKLVNQGLRFGLVGTVGGIHFQVGGLRSTRSTIFMKELPTPSKEVSSRLVSSVWLQPKIAVMFEKIV